MAPASIVTLIVVGLLVVALAYYLITVVVLLRRLIDTLGKITFGLRAIAHRTAPVNDIVSAIEEDLGAIDQTLQTLLAAKTQQERVS